MRGWWWQYLVMISGERVMMGGAGDVAEIGRGGPSWSGQSQSRAWPEPSSLCQLVLGLQPVRSQWLCDMMTWWHDDMMTRWWQWCRVIPCHAPSPASTASAGSVHRPGPDPSVPETHLDQSCSWRRNISEGLSSLSRLTGSGTMAAGHRWSGPPRPSSSWGPRTWLESVLLVL